MYLFKRLLLALFPEGIGVQENMSPTSMFISFISSREFFSVITRKIVENFKLNLFDVSLDPFEVKVGFGERSAISVKNLDFYYWYCASANLNGYRMFSPSNVASSVSIVSSIYLQRSFDWKNKNYFLYCILTVYLLHFVFAAKIKVFPYHGDVERNFNRFIDLFWSFYLIVLEKFWFTYRSDFIEDIKKIALKQTDLFFMIYYSYQHISSVFFVQDEEYQDFVQRMFYEESKKKLFHETLTEYISHMTTYRNLASFSDSEQKLIRTLMPADILIKYLFDHESLDLLIRSLVNSLFDKDKLNAFLRSFLTSGQRFEEFILFITHYRGLKDNFFQWVQTFFTQYRYNRKDSSSVLQEIDEFMSSIWDLQSLDGQSISLPEAVKDESLIMEKLMNFYITHIGWLRVARGDNFFIRIFRRPLLQDLMRFSMAHNTLHDTLQYYGGILYAYSKNVFYYTYAFENIKAWKEKFHLPFKSTLKEVYFSMFLLKLFDESFWIILLQEINVKDIKIFVQQKNILHHFKKLFAAKISTFVLQDTPSLIRSLYSPIEDLLPGNPFFTSLLLKHLTTADIACIKENLYNINFWVFYDFLYQLRPIAQELTNSYPVLPIVWILASIKETLLGLLLFLSYGHSHASTSHSADSDKKLIIEFYCSDILGLQEHIVEAFLEVFSRLLHYYQPLCHPWIDIDDNRQFLTIGYNTWLQFSQIRNGETNSRHALGEDVIRFRWYLKNITYYNGRFLLPKDI